MYTTDKIVFTVDSFSQFLSLVHCVLIIEKILPTEITAFEFKTNRQ
jgi:hypothetical protein